MGEWGGETNDEQLQFILHLGRNEALPYLIFQLLQILILDNWFLKLYINSERSRERSLLPPGDLWQRE